jgi:hypothetical protein
MYVKGWPTKFQSKRLENEVHRHVMSGLKITAGQRTMSGQNRGLTSQSISLPIILTGHFF